MGRAGQDFGGGDDEPNQPGQGGRFVGSGGRERPGGPGGRPGVGGRQGAGGRLANGAGGAVSQGGRPPIGAGGLNGGGGLSMEAARLRAYACWQSCDAPRDCPSARPYSGGCNQFFQACVITCEDGCPPGLERVNAGTTCWCEMPNAEHDSFDGRCCSYDDCGPPYFLPCCSGGQCINGACVNTIPR